MTKLIRLSIRISPLHMGYSLLQIVGANAHKEMNQLEKIEYFREYETIYILRNDFDADAANRVAQRVNEVIEREQGRLLKFESWGRRKLAYEIQKQRKGIYIYVKYLGRGGLVQELERNLRLQDAVIKYITVQTDDQVNPSQIVVDPEEAKVRQIELLPEEDEVLTREHMLGFVEYNNPHSSSRHDMSGEEFDGEDLVAAENKM